MITNDVQRRSEAMSSTQAIADRRDASSADTLSQKGAMALAKRLQAFWHARGYPAARFWTEPVGERFAKVGTYDIYRVACNLENGLPPRYREVRSDMEGR